MILSLAAAIAVVLSVMSYFSATSAALPNLAGIVASPFRSLSAAVTETLGGWMDYFTEFDALKEENRQLKLQIAEMEEEVRQATFDREENAHLRKVAELREQRRDLHLESARVLVQDSSNWYSQLTINKGTMHEIEVGDCVVNEEGALIGVVTEAGRQPWAIQDLMPVRVAASKIPGASVSVTFFLFLALFTALFVAEVSILLRQIKIGPDAAGNSEPQKL